MIKIMIDKEKDQEKSEEVEKFLSKVEERIRKINASLNNNAET